MSVKIPSETNAKTNTVSYKSAFQCSTEESNDNNNGLWVNLKGFSTQNEDLSTATEPKTVHYVNISNNAVNLIHYLIQSECLKGFFCKPGKTKKYN